MQWLGKAIGAALGLVAAGPVGSLIGVLIGHQFDQGMQANSAAGQGPAETQGAFFQATFEIMGHLAKVDGRVTEGEIRVARGIMQGMRLTPEQVKLAIERFSVGKNPSYPLPSKLAALKRHLGHNRDLMRAFVEIQVRAAVGGSDITQAKRQLLWEVARELGVGRAELAQMEALMRAYGVLGIEPVCSDTEVKAAYRRLMNLHHPDKLIAKGLSESMTTRAEQRTHEIRAAYEQIKAMRAFK